MARIHNIIRRRAPRGTNAAGLRGTTAAGLQGTTAAGLQGTTASGAAGHHRHGAPPPRNTSAAARQQCSGKRPRTTIPGNDPFLIHVAVHAEQDT
ncbi:unnamed protein product [Boreogadus saida]